MPRYYFHIREGDEMVRDEEGLDCEDARTARHEAIESAREIMSESLLQAHLGDTGKFVIPTPQGRLCSRSRSTKP
jgi:hypothetical protein